MAPVGASPCSWRACAAGLAQGRTRSDGHRDLAEEAHLCRPSYRRDDRSPRKSRCQVERSGFEQLGATSLRKKPTALTRSGLVRHYRYLHPPGLFTESAFHSGSAHLLAATGPANSFAPVTLKASFVLMISAAGKYRLAPATEGGSKP